MAAVAAHLAKAYPETNRDWGVNVIPLGDRGVSDVPRAVHAALDRRGAGAADWVRQRGESAAGARHGTAEGAHGAKLRWARRRRRLMRQLVTEGVLLSLAGGLLGIGSGMAA